ncbi:mannitol dehydrogenase family protein (plasmid) [Saccharobesus litoralis]|uniref:Mannitol dehydrogenase family protein n=1 Tax=Saccharobesus litoralis TaxID=2172099 RepID=A0A2S0VYH6_9ALTE|nr:mannitol dehydrogenase family protein [Saccharobesus litoralis]AWB69235.1 mannitol dehydrogenase family protein [Saccharobesus litoralis]
MKLNEFNINKLANDVSLAADLALPKYDRSATKIGIVHLGLGAFHRSHQAYYTEQAMNQFGGDWGICGVSMRSTHLRDTMAPQDNLYTVAKLDNQDSFQVIGAIKEVLVAAEQLDQVLARLSDEATKLVSLTVTEKGYCLDAHGNLDLKNASIEQDLANTENPQSAIGIIALGLHLRFQAGIKPFNVIACDNLPANGQKLKNAVVQYCRFLSTELSEWVEQTVCFPNTMVDSITPKTEPETLDLVTEKTGLVDNAPVQREAFTQWVIEDCLTGEQPNWRDVGVIFSNDVAGYEHTKLRILNGLHSTLAYFGRVAGFTTVYQAVSDPTIKAFLLRLVDEEIIPSIEAPAGLDLHAYSRAIIQRFENSKIQHQLEQIACDGSIKIPVRSLEPVAENLAKGKPVKLLAMVVASWLRFIELKVLNSEELSDPLAEKLADVVSQFEQDAIKDVQKFVSLSGLFNSQLINSADFKQAFICAYQKLLDAQDYPQGALI